MRLRIILNDFLDDNDSAESQQSFEELEMSITAMENTQEFKNATKVLFYQIKKKRHTSISVKSLISLYADDIDGSFVRN